MYRIILLASIAVLGMTGAGRAQILAISFSGSGVTATGLISVTNGIAESGYLDITSGFNLGHYDLAALGSAIVPYPSGGSTDDIEFNDGTVYTFDDAVNLGSDPFVTGNGLVFANTRAVGFDLYSNGPGSYTLFDVGNDVYFGANGVASYVQLEAPEPSTLALLLGGLTCFFWRLRVRRTSPL